MQSAQAKTHYKTKQDEPSRNPAKRVVKMDGNVAYVSSGFAKKKIQQPAKSARTMARSRKKAKSGLASTLFVLFIAFCALAMLISRYAIVCSIGSQNNELERKIETIEADIDNMSVNLELKDNLEYVHRSAQSDLGMKYADQSQKIKISLDG